MAIDIMKEEPFASAISTLQKTSLNKPTSDDKFYMTESLMPVVNFDHVVDAYAKKYHVHPFPASNDALLQVDDMFFFVEFKDGKMSNGLIHELKRKNFESLLIFLDLMHETLSFARQHVKYVLVYNGEKSKDYIAKCEQNAATKLEKSEYVSSPSYLKIMGCVGHKAKTNPDIFGLRKQFEGIYFKEMYFYSKEDFFPESLFANQQKKEQA